MFPERRVNALTPIFASLHREDEDLSLAPKIPFKHVHNSLQQLQTCSRQIFKRLTLSVMWLEHLTRYKKNKQKHHKKTNTKRLPFDFFDEEKESVAPFAKHHLDELAENTTLALPSFFSEHLAYGEIIQEISNAYQVALGLQQPIKAGQKLLLSGYDTADFKHDLSFSKLGPTAGLLTYDPFFCEGNVVKQQKHQQEIEKLLLKDAQLVQLVLSESLIKNAIQYGQLQKIKRHLYAAIYFGKQMSFKIAPPQYLVQSQITEKPVMVLANTSQAITPITDNYRLTCIAPRKNTPSEMLFHNNKLEMAVLRALNKKINKEHFFILSDNFKAHFEQTEFFFFPKMQPKQLLATMDRAVFYQELEANGYLIKKE